MGKLKIGLVGEIPMIHTAKLIFGEVASRGRIATVRLKSLYNIAMMHDK